jgi:hypothetical protein
MRSGRVDPGALQIHKPTGRLYAFAAAATSEGCVMESGLPYADLGYAVVEQAVNDVKSLTECGVIVNGRAITDWPFAINKKGHKVAKDICFYRSTEEVESLIRSFTDGCVDTWLRLLDSDLTGRQIAKEIGLL